MELFFISFVREEGGVTRYMLSLVCSYRRVKERRQKCMNAVSNKLSSQQECSKVFYSF